MVIVFVGPPGSGKGTQAQSMEREKSVLHVSTGNLLRQEITSESDLGKAVQEKVGAGEFPADEVVLQLVASVVRKNVKRSIIFDGFPRTLNQAIAFDALLGVENLKVDIVFDFDIDTQALIERIKGRYTCSQCGAVYHDLNKNPKNPGVCDQCGGKAFDKRQDDTIEVLQKRVKIYQENTQSIKKYYRDRGLLKKIDASHSTEEVSRSINAALSEAGLII